MAASSSDRAASVDRVRGCRLAPPEVTERLSHSTPTWFVRGKKTFVVFHDQHHQDGRIDSWAPAPAAVQGALLALDPVGFFVPPYVGGRGWIGVRLDRDVAWDQIEELIEDAHRQVAPHSLISQPVSD